VANANYAWLQHILWHLSPNGSAGVVLANGSMSSAQSGEDVIRRAMIGADVVDCMIALPGQLFYSTPIPACLWFLARNKNPGGKWRDRRDEVLFIDARKLGYMVDRTRRELSDTNRWSRRVFRKPYESSNVLSDRRSNWYSRSAPSFHLVP